MPTLHVKLDVEPVSSLIKRLGVATASRAVVGALNKTIAGVNTDASRAVRSELTLKAKDVKRDLRVMRASPGQLEAGLKITVRPTGLIKFRARDTTRGVTFQVKRSGGRKRLKSAFIAKMPSGHRGVFTRKRGVKRLPINELFSTSVGQYLDDDDVLNPIGEAAMRRFNKELSSQIDRFTK